MKGDIMIKKEKPRYDLDYIYRIFKSFIDKKSAYDKYAVIAIDPNEFTTEYGSIEKYIDMSFQYFYITRSYKIDIIFNFINNSLDSIHIASDDYYDKFKHAMEFSGFDVFFNNGTFEPNDVDVLMYIEVIDIINNVIKENEGGKIMYNLFISQPMTNRDDSEIRQERETISFVTSVLTGCPDIKLIEQFDVDETMEDYKALNDNQIRMHRLNRSLGMMEKANIIVFARNWWTSPGCIQEYIEYRLYMNTALCIMGSQIEDTLYELYGDVTSPYDHEAEQTVIDTIDVLLSCIKQPTPCMMLAPKILYKSGMKISEPDDIETDDEFNEEDAMSFRDYVDTFIGEDKEYGCLIHEKLVDILNDAVVHQYGDNVKSQHVANGEITNKGNYGCLYTILTDANNKDVRFTLDTQLNSIKYENEEYLGANYIISMNENGRSKNVISIEYLPSQTAPESQDRVSQLIRVHYIGAANISNKTARAVFVKINKKFKEFVNNDDRMVWYKIK